MVFKVFNNRFLYYWCKVTAFFSSPQRIFPKLKGENPYNVEKSCIFDCIEDTLARKNPNYICFFARLIVSLHRIKETDGKKVSFIITFGNARL